MSLVWGLKHVCWLFTHGCPTEVVFDDVFIDSPIFYLLILCSGGLASLLTAEPVAVSLWHQSNPLSL